MPELAGGDGGLDLVQKADALLVAMTCHALPDHRTVEDIERRKQRGGAMPNIMVRHRCGPAPLDPQTRLNAIERKGGPVLYVAKGPVPDVA